ncbi:MAG TPA: hypothetical protein VJZ00_24845 [Thermoanaerobaculia bacterium]|nr:hypothetical protein [Thermoanaerobaculia bacterium]
MSIPSLALLAFATLVDRGIAVDLTLAPKAVRDGDTIHVAFSVRDEATKTPLGGARPLAWVAPRGGDCVANAARFLSGSLTDRPAADLNNYYVLALNDDASISVVDPRFSFGGSQLLAMLTLESRGDDWALTPDGKTLYVSMPDAHKIAVADTTTWKVVRNVDVGGRPGRIALQPDGERLWVVLEDRVVLLGREGAPRSYSLPLRAERGLAFSPSSAFIGESIFDLRTLARKTFEFPARVVAYSSAAQLAYAGDPASGRIAGINTRVRFNATPGFTQIRFAPGGRYGFLPNPQHNIVEIFDAASNRIVRTVDVSDGPDQVTFTDRLAFVRRRGSDAVIMIPLQSLATSGDGTGVADFTGGERALGGGRVAALADSIVEAPDGPAVLVANPGDAMIYYYKEGMAAPMGGFSNYGRQPRAVLVVDRSLRERTRGVYSTSAKIDDPGAYDVVFFLDSPRVTACFPLEVAARPETLAKRAKSVLVEPLSIAHDFAAGAPARIRFRLADAKTRRVETPRDVQVVVMQAPGVWQRRTSATATSDGAFEVEVTPPSSGVYYVWVASAAAGLPINNPQFITFEVHQ